MTKRLKKWLLGEILDLILIVAIGLFAGWYVNHHVKERTQQVISDILRNEWIQAAHEAAVTEETLGGYDTSDK